MLDGIFSKLGEFLKDDFDRPSSSRLLLVGTWLVSSGSVIYSTIAHTLSEWHFSAYLACFASTYWANKIHTKGDRDDSSPTQ